MSKKYKTVTHLPSQINIFGSVYNIVHNADLPFDRDGECNSYDKLILLRDRNYFAELGEMGKDQAISEILSHEILHGVLYEAGLVDYSADETLVGALGVLFPKIVGLFEEVGLL